jgi:site-specific DNA-methyltransferase (adenine-specific)
VIASKGRFDRARSVKERERLGLPYESSLTSDEFMAATLDLWEIAPESARRVQHPAPFPVELPERLIQLYTYREDLVLDPFMGSGSTLVAAARTGRRYVGYDLDPSYVALARRRVGDELCRLNPGETLTPSPARTSRRAAESLSIVESDESEDFQVRAARAGKAAQAIAEGVLEDAGFTVMGRNARLRGLGLTVSVVANDAGGIPWYFDVSGAFTTTRGGLFRIDAVWRSLGRAHVLARTAKRPLVLLTSHLPKRPSEGDTALRAAGPSAFFDAVEMLSTSGRARLEQYARGGHHEASLPGFWTPEEVGRGR